MNLTTPVRVVRPLAPYISCSVVRRSVYLSVGLAGRVGRPEGGVWAACPTTPKWIVPLSPVVTGSRHTTTRSPPRVAVLNSPRHSDHFHVVVAASTLRSVEPRGEEMENARAEFRQIGWTKKTKCRTNHVAIHFLRWRKTGM